MTLTHRPLRATAASVAILALGAFGLTACAADSEPAASNGAPASCEDFAQEITVAQAPVTDFAPVWVAQQEGFFADHGLDVTLGEPAGTGAESVALINSGQVDLIAGSPSATLSAASQGIMTEVVVGMTLFPDAEDRDPAAIIVSASSDIETPADLEGKTVGVTSINSQQQSKVMGTVDADGGDASAVTFIQVPTASMASLLEKGEIDAIQPFEPVGTQLTANPAFRVIGYANWQTIGGTPAMFLSTTPAWKDENPCAVEAVRGAISDAVDFINEEANADRFAEILAENTKSDVELMASVRTDDFTTELTEASYEKLAEHLVEYGVLTGDADIAAILGD